MARLLSAFLTALLVGLFFGCGKDSTILISKETQGERTAVIRSDGAVSYAHPQKIRVELIFAKASKQIPEGSITLLNGETVVSGASRVYYTQEEGTEVTFVAKLGPKWKVRHWKLFPGTTEYYTQTTLGQRLHLSETRGDQYVVLTAEPR